MLRSLVLVSLVACGGPPHPPSAPPAVEDDRERDAGVAVAEPDAFCISQSEVDEMLAVKQATSDGSAIDPGAVAHPPVCRIERAYCLGRRTASEDRYEHHYCPIGELCELPCGAVCISDDEQCGPGNQITPRSSPPASATNASPLVASQPGGCTRGCACGNTCIACGKTCHVAAGDGPHRRSTGRRR